MQKKSLTISFNNIKNSVLNNITINLKQIQNFIVNFNKNKKKRILERTFFSDNYFIKIFPEKDKYFNNFKDIFYSNNPFPFANKHNDDDFLKTINTDFKKNIISKVDLILNDEYNILKRAHRFENEINWFYSFSNKYSWPFKRSSKINWILNKKIDIDIKYSLRLNYHQEFVTLGLAFFITKDEKYSEKFFNLISDWIIKNPPNWGINWIDFLEVAHRVINWIFALSFFKDSKYLNEIHFKKIAKSLFQQIFFIKLNNNKRTYNHTIGEQFIIFLFSSIFKTLRPLNKWYKKSKKILIRQIKRQIQEDGVNIEQTTNYHRLVLEIFSLLLIISPDLIAENECKLIEKMFEFWGDIIKPDSKIPLIGDSDDAHFFPLVFFKNEKDVNLELLNLGSILYNRSDFKTNFTSYKKIPLILLLLFRNKTLKKYEELKKTYPKEKIKYFHASGFVVGRSDWTTKANYLFFDMGQFRQGSSHHKHSDISNIIYSFEGKPILIDSGTYMYNISSNKRNLFRSSQAHNILSINNQNQAKISGTWSWENIPNIQQNFVQYKNGFSAIVEHNGYKNFLVRRQIIAPNNLMILKIIETIIPIKKIEKATKISCFFHFPSTIQLDIHDNYLIIDSNLKLELLTNLKRFDIIKEDFPFSPYYGIKKKSQLVKFNFIYNFNKKEPLKMKFIFSSLNKN